MTSGLVRDADGVLGWHGGRHYVDPKEAVKTWGSGKLNLGCAESVCKHYSTAPCGKTPKYDPDANGQPTRCGVHRQSAKAKRKAAFDARYEKWRNQSKAKADQARAQAAIEPALRQIAAGHNDPRTLAQDVLAVLDAAIAAAKAV